ncbi:MAG: flagellar M-ring protein FliF [Betaproteobacteria bacterium]|nr:flagellar M-ring protein FliF [Betaproteobacteria bacterium]
MAAHPTVLTTLNGFGRLPPVQKLGFLVAVAAAASLVAAWWLWSQTPDWRVLYSNLSDRDGGAVVNALSQMSVPYKVAEGGGAILVPADQVHDSRLKLASQGLPKGSIVGFEILDGQKLGVTQFQEQVAYQRALEGELSRSVQALAAVAGARVHLAIPRATSFLRESQKPTASVLVNLHPGRSLERAQVAGIVHLVASSVPELTPKGVSVVDQNGALLSSSATPDGTAALDAGQLAYVNQIETAFARRIEEILEPVVGRANVRAQVTADVDFSVQESTAETFRPNASGQEAALRTQSVSENSDGGRGAALGVPGAASNQPAAPPVAAATSSSGSQRRETNTQYEVDRTVKRVRQPVGAVRRLSAAVVVNHRRSTDADGKVTTAALTADEMTQIQSLVKEAIGLNTTRGDTINIANAPFAVEAVAPAEETPLWKDPAHIATAKEVAKNAGVGLLVLYLLLGVLRPILRNLSAAGAAPAAPLDLIEGESRALAPGEDPVQAVRAIARQDPKRVANVVKTWVATNE